MVKTPKADRPGMHRNKHHSEYAEVVQALKREGELQAAERLLAQLIDAVEAEDAVEKFGVAPWCYQQMAIIKRKLRDRAGEIDVLERFAAQRHAPGKAVEALLERLRKLRADEAPLPPNRTHLADIPAAMQPADLGPKRQRRCDAPPRYAVVLDVETTGFSAEKDKIVSWAAAKVDLQDVARKAAKGGIRLDALHEIVNPGRPIPKDAAAVHGIKTSDVKSAPSFAESAQELRSYIGDSPIIGHNVDFDLGFLNAEFAAAGVEILDSSHVFCTMRHFQKTCNNGRRQGSSLEVAANRLFGEGRRGKRHEALEDVRLTTLLAAAFYARCTKMRGGIAAIADFDAPPTAAQDDDNAGGLGSIASVLFWLLAAGALLVWLVF